MNILFGWRGFEGWSKTATVTGLPSAFAVYAHHLAATRRVSTAVDDVAGLFRRIEGPAAAVHRRQETHAETVVGIPAQRHRIEARSRRKLRVPKDQRDRCGLLQRHDSDLAAFDEKFLAVRVGPIESLDKLRAGSAEKLAPWRCREDRGASRFRPLRSLPRNSRHSLRWRTSRHGDACGRTVNRGGSARRRA